MRLIVTEKNNSAKKIAEILGGSPKTDKAYKVPFYTWSDADGEHLAIGLKGHLLKREFTEEYDNWQKTDIHELIDAELADAATDKNVLRALKKVAKDADEIIIATDFDREGELIGLEALQEAVDANPEITGQPAALPNGERPAVKRARYSALTKQEIERAFSNIDELSYQLADAGGARQDIDLLWGAALTRAVSLATRRFGSNFLSVGRVQSPTLGLIVERELERRAHVAKPYWELFARFAHPDGSFEAHHTTDRFWEKAEADSALAGTATPGVVKEIASKRNIRKPPAPFNTTSFTTEASSRLGITPAAVMRIAEDLYMDGFISYPRTDNTVYPESLPLRELVSSLAKVPDFSAAAPLLEQGPLTPTRGKKQTTDHPPIYPTQALYPGALEGPKRRVYELVVRRFLATFSPPMVSESTRADIEAGSETYFVRGSVVVDPGFAAIYTYSRSPDEEIPKLEEGQELALESEPWVIDKETQPPSRLSQGKLIELMEEAGLGTKATRADIIQKLYDRGYVFNNPPEPSETGMAIYEAFSRHVPEMATPEMTAKLEADMDRIAAGDTSKDEVIGTSRKLLHHTYDEIKEHEEDLAKTVWAGMDQDKILGPCPECEEAGRTHEDGSPNMLRIIEMRGGKRFCGCQGYNRDDPDAPDSCRFSRPLPGRGYELFKMAPRCPTCNRTPRLKVKPFRGRTWELCLNDECPDMLEMQRKKAERLAAREAKEAISEAADGDASDGKAKPDTATRKVRRAKRSPAKTKS